MGYDENGRWIGIDPNDPLDQEEIHESHKRRMVDKYVDEQYKIAQQQHAANEIVAEILTEEGIDQATYQQLLNDSPDVAKEAFRTATKHLVRSVKKGRTRDPKTGQFVSGSPAPRAGVPHRETGPSNERLDALRETSRKRELTEDESIEAVEHLIGKLI